MTDTLKVLGQSKPAAGALTALYTVPAATATVVSTLRINNLSTATTIRVSVAVAGAADATSQSVLGDSLPLAANQSLGITEGWTLGAADVLRILSASGNVVFTAFGSERT